MAKAEAEAGHHSLGHFAVDRGVVKESVACGECVRQNTVGNRKQSRHCTCERVKKVQHPGTLHRTGRRKF